MRIFRHFADLPASARGGAVALGNFDGVHRGHQAVIRAMLDSARRHGVPSGAMTFEPHPRAVFNPALPPFRLTPLRAKARLLFELGVDFLVIQHFDLAFAKIGATEFVDRVLVQGLGAREVVVGHDFVFGHRRLGDAELLARMSAERGYTATFVDPVTGEDGTQFSSTVVRESLLQGRIGDATRLLGRQWEIEGHVHRGDGRGRELGYPTANVALGDSLRPAAGVYAVHAALADSNEPEWRAGVAYCGPRPTFGKTETVLEVNLFDFAQEIYGRTLRVAFVERLRGDRRFDDIAALKAQMVEDERAARRLLAASVAARADS